MTRNKTQNRKRRRQAEFLVYNTVNISALLGIGVINEHVQQRVEHLLRTHQVELPVRTRRNWYY